MTKNGSKRAKNRQKKTRFACLQNLEELGSTPTTPPPSSPFYGTIRQKSIWPPASNEFKIIFIIFKISIVGSRQPDGSGHMTLLCCRFLTAGRLLTSQCRFFYRSVDASQLMLVYAQAFHQCPSKVSGKKWLCKPSFVGLVATYPKSPLIPRFLVAGSNSYGGAGPRTWQKACCYPGQAIGFYWYGQPISWTEQTAHIGLGFATVYCSHKSGLTCCSWIVPDRFFFFFFCIYIKEHPLLLFLTERQHNLALMDQSVSSGILQHI